MLRGLKTWEIRGGRRALQERAVLWNRADMFSPQALTRWRTLPNTLIVTRFLSLKPISINAMILVGLGALPIRTRTPSLAQIWMNFQNNNDASDKEGKQAATQTEDVGQSAVDPVCAHAGKFRGASICRQSVTPTIAHVKP